MTMVTYSGLRVNPAAFRFARRIIIALARAIVQTSKRSVYEDRGLPCWVETLKGFRHPFRLTTSERPWKSDFPPTNRPTPVNAEENEARLRLLPQFYRRPAHSLQPARSHCNRRHLPKPCGP